MKKVSIAMPGENGSSQEGIVTKWLSTVGSGVAEGDIIAEVETEKVTQQVEAPISGVLLEILVKEGETATAGQAIAIVGESRESG